MLASFLAFSFGLIGGNFVGPGSLPDAVRRLSLLTPNGWAMDAFTELSAGSATAADVLLHAAVLTAMAAAIGGAAAVLLPRRIGARR
jgi:ABC-2 type transport system permease protein